MVKAFIGAGCAFAAISAALILYCCVRLGAEEDRWMEAGLPHGKGESGHGTDNG